MQIVQPSHLLRFPAARIVVQCRADGSPAVTRHLLYLGYAAVYQRYHNALFFRLCISIIFTIFVARISHLSNSSAKVVIIFGTSKCFGEKIRNLYSFMGNLIEKVAIIAAKEGLSINAMEKKIGASKGVLGRAISQNSDIQAKWVMTIAHKFPKYSAEWLLRDEEPMLRREVAPNITTATGHDAMAVGVNQGTIVPVAQAKKTLEENTDVTALLQAKDEVIRTQQDMIATQKAFIETLQKYQK